MNLVKTLLPKLRMRLGILQRTNLRKKINTKQLNKKINEARNNLSRSSSFSTVAGDDDLEIIRLKV